MSHAYRRQILDLLRGYRPAQLLIACTELGVFEALAAGPASAAELGTRLGLRPEVLARLLNAAVALGLLEQTDGRYTNAPLAAACLSVEGPFFVGNLVRREGAFYQRWGYLTEAVRSGRHPEENRRDEDQTGWVRTFERALYDAARTTAPLIAELLGPLLPTHAVPRVIDVGGGHGAYSIALAQRYPALTATIFELPAVVPVAQEFVAAAGLAARVAVQTGDFKRDELGTGYDLALLFGVLVSETPEGAMVLLRKVRAALSPGGAVVIRGFYLNPDRAGPLDATLFDLHMLLSTDAGAAHTSDEIAAWLAAAGFAPAKASIASEPEPIHLLVAHT